MPTFTTVDANWDTGVTLDAAELRRGDTAMFLGDGAANGVRGGIVRHGDTSLAVTVNGSDQVTVQPGAFVIPAATGLGVYRGALSAAVGPTAGTALSARNATNPRIDLIVIQATGTNATVKTVDGTPSASPSAPALPAQHIELARVTVPATGGGAVTVDSTFRSYATGLGGTLFVETSARLPGSGNQKGQRAVALDTGFTHEWNGTAWTTPGIWQNYTPNLVNWTGASNVTAGRYTQIGKTVHFRAKVTLGTGFGVVGAPGLSLPVAASTTGTTMAHLSGVLTDTGTASYSAFATVAAAARAEFYILGTNGAAGNISSTAPFTWAVGDVIEVAGTYEAA